jgi:serine protease Do
LLRESNQQSSNETQEEAPSPHRSPLDRFFRRFGIPMPDAPVPRTGFALGSGFFVSSDGYVVTNNHVVANGISFEVSIDSGKTYQAKVIGVQELKDKGRVTRGWIGVQVQPVTPTIAEATGLKNAAGALVAQVEPNSPAARGGIESGDVITSVNGEVVTDSRDLARKTAATAPGAATNVVVFRNGQEKTLILTTGELPRRTVEAKAADQTTTSEAPSLGVTLAPASTVPGAGDHGVVVTEIDPAGRAAESGLHTGDVIIEVSNHAVNTAADVRKMVDEARSQSKRAIMLRIKRSDAMSFVAIAIA